MRTCTAANVAVLITPLCMHLLPDIASVIKKFIITNEGNAVTTDTA